MYHPIHQCSNGHTWCLGYKPRVHNRCPTCMHELYNNRCLDLKRIAASLEPPCKYQSFGCLGTYPYYSKLKHESQCVYRPYYCPYAGPECIVIDLLPGGIHSGVFHINRFMFFSARFKLQKMAVIAVSGLQMATTRSYFSCSHRIFKARVAILGANSKGRLWAKLASACHIS